MSALSGRRLAMYVFLCAVWGSTWLAIKIGLRDLPALSFAGVRMALACVLLTPFAFIGSGRRPSATEWGWIAWGGFLQIGVSYACIFLAEQRIDTGLAALLFATFPIFVGVFAHFLLPAEPLTPRTVASALVGLSGVAVIEGPALAASFATTETHSLLIGGALILLSAMVAGYSNVVNKKHLGGVSAFRNVWGQTLVGSSVLLLGAAAFERGAPARWTASAAWATVYLAVIGTALPFVGLFWLIRRVPVSVIGTIPVVDTVIAIVLGSLVLGESFSPRILAGGALILVGVLLAAAPQRPPSPDHATA
ncbi:MAG TPA: EamA family transporter [Thermoanaerobaculia bacterium]|nr:EamA family transporter [Thermoanaerobaculia bacterium]